MNTDSSFFEKSIRIAENFLQTAVIIDDRLFEEDFVQKAKELKVPLRKKAFPKKTDSPKRISDSEQSNSDPHAVAPQALINAFAKKRIFCSAYQPKRKDFSTQSQGEFRKLCRTADIIIVDWSLFQDDGQKAMEIISGIVEDSIKETPEQLRLIITYTGEQNLFEIMNKI